MKVWTYFAIFMFVSKCSLFGIPKSKISNFLVFESSIESQSHLLWCPAYKNLREEKNLNNDDDLLEYVKKVLEIRQDLKLRR